MLNEMVTCFFTNVDQILDDEESSCRFKEKKKLLVF